MRGNARADRSRQVEKGERNIWAGSSASASSRLLALSIAESLQDMNAQSLARLQPLTLRRSCRLPSYNGACGEVL